MESYGVVWSRTVSYGVIWGRTSSVDQSFTLSYRGKQICRGVDAAEV